LIDAKYIPPLGYGQFSYNADVVVAGSNIATPVPYDTTEIAQFCGFSGSYLKGGVWKFAYSVEISQSSTAEPGAPGCPGRIVKFGGSV